MKQRFYEADPTVSQAVSLMMLFPVEMQSVIANALSEIAERECKARELMNDFRSMGREKVLALHKSKKKGREYDENPATHRAMNYMMILSPEQRLFIAQKIIQLSGYIQDYLKTCKTYNQQVSVNQVESISNSYVTMGPEHTRHFMELFKNELQKQSKAAVTQQEVPSESQEPVKPAASAPDKPAEPGKAPEPARASGRSEAIHAKEGVGMRIKGDRLP